MSSSSSLLNQPPKIWLDLARLAKEQNAEFYFFDDLNLDPNVNLKKYKIYSTDEKTNSTRIIDISNNKIKRISNKNLIAFTDNNFNELFEHLPRSPNERRTALKEFAIKLGCSIDEQPSVLNSQRLIDQIVKRLLNLKKENESTSNLRMQAVSANQNLDPSISNSLLSSKRSKRKQPPPPDLPSSSSSSCYTVPSPSVDDGRIPQTQPSTELFHQTSASTPVIPIETTPNAIVLDTNPFADPAGDTPFSSQPPLDYPFLFFDEELLNKELDQRPLQDPFTYSSSSSSSHTPFT